MFTSPLLLVFWTYLVFVIHTTLGPALAVGTVGPHLVLSALAVTVQRMPAATAVMCAAWWGLLSDCLQGTGLGVDMLCFAWLALAWTAWSYQPGRTNVWGLMLSAGAGTALVLLASWTLRAWQTPAAVDDQTWSLPLIGAAAYSAALTGVWSLSHNWWTARHPQHPPPGNRQGLQNQWKMLTH